MDLNIKCGDPEDHTPYIWGFTLPLLFLYGLGVPCFLFYKVYNNSKSTSSKFES